MGSDSKVMVVDDEMIVVERLQEHLEKAGFTVEGFTESQAAMDRLAESSFQVVVTDLKMKGPDGLEILHFDKQAHPATQVIIITGYASMDASREAEYSGVFDFITKPFNLPAIASMVKKAAKKASRLESRSGS
jgi:DNA-binding NtrC family response regulator